MKKITIELKDQILEYEGKAYKIIVEPLEEEMCICGCGKPRRKNSKYATETCRKRAWRNKQRVLKS